MTRSGLPRLVAAMLLVATTASCAYYNTFYLARKYYMKATEGRPYEVDREGTTQRSNYTKSGDYSKKLLGVYPRSKWVDDAWLMWARALVGTDDPLKAVTMLQEFETRFPNSELRPDAEFFLGLSYRAARKHELAVERFDEFLAQAPRHELVPYAYYERSKALLSLRRFEDAANSAGEVMRRFPKHTLYDRALRQRAEARYQQRAWAGAREDFKAMGSRALTDDERLRFLLREVDCLESSRAYEEARGLLREARSHVPPPPPRVADPTIGVSANTNTPALQAQLQQQPLVNLGAGRDHYGKVTLRMGGVELLAGHVEQAVEFYRTVLQDYPRSQLAAEAQFRIGYAYETGADNFVSARTEYLRVKEHTGQSQFVQQAQQRLENLDRIDRFRTAGGEDSLERKAEARFLTAEHYLFNLERTDRALEEYRAIADSSASPAVQARALNAQAWLLSRKLDRKSEGDSLFWLVVRKYPSTEAQLAARDYLEAEGQLVPENLIVAPKEAAKPLLDTGEALTPLPVVTPTLGARPPGTMPDHSPASLASGTLSNATGVFDPTAWRGANSPDSLHRVMALRDSMMRQAHSDTSAAGRTRLDSLRRAIARPDTTGRSLIMAELSRRVPKADSVVVAPADAPPPDLMAVDSTESGVAPHSRMLGGNVPSQAVRVDDSRALPPTAHAIPPIVGSAAADSAQRVRAAAMPPPSASADSARLVAKVVPRPVAPLAEPAAALPAPGYDSRSIVSPSIRWTRAQRDSIRRARSSADSLRKENADSKRRAKAEAAATRRAKSRGDSPGKALPAPASAPNAPPDSTRSLHP